MKVGVFLSDETHRGLKVRAAEKGVSMTRLIEELIEAFLSKKGKR